MTTAQDVRSRTIFPTLVLECTVPDAERINVELKQAILQKKSEDAGIHRSNFNGWHSKDDILQWGGDAMRTVAVAAIEMCNGFTHDDGMKNDEPRFSWSIQAWANVSQKGASNQYHAHPGAFWSAVYFVDDGGSENSGQLVLQDPRFPLNKMTVPDLSVRDTQGNRERTEISVTPKPGRMLAFPSWLTHGVRPHQGEQDRISIAMNLIASPIAKPAS
ncbi:TIGR02466 family protein [Parvularcula sp. IMCC14364]|uniref:TIGR02466 family protein n=1 Tax=Parvularcula sp. IMCC14364 TaxID=3067902 RepID=UPI0027421887|nr:TIGR02466 family protein [Parvularcula sp. IMCC14364]